MDTLFLVILAIGVTILLFLALRELVCWYYKINKRIELMEDQNSLLKKILEKLNTTKT
jgi:hypothetical protein